MAKSRDFIFEMIDRACAISLDLLKEKGWGKDLLRLESEILVVTATFTYIELTHEFQGEQVYIPKKPRDRDQKIKDAFNGNNINELVSIFGVNRATVYRALYRTIKRTAKKQERDIVETMIDGLFRREISRNTNAIKSDNWMLIYLKFAASKTFKNLLQNEI